MVFDTVGIVWNSFQPYLVQLLQQPWKLSILNWSNLTFPTLYNGRSKIQLLVTYSKTHVLNQLTLWPFTSELKNPHWGCFHVQSPFWRQCQNWEGMVGVLKMKSEFLREEPSGFLLCLFIGQAKVSREKWIPNKATNTHLTAFGAF